MNGQTEGGRTYEPEHEETEGGRTYQVEVKCRNCGNEDLVSLPLGTPISEPSCPNCECRGVLGLRRGVVYSGRGK